MRPVQIPRSWGWTRPYRRFTLAASRDEVGPRPVASARPNSRVAGRWRAAKLHITRQPSVWKERVIDRVRSTISDGFEALRRPASRSAATLAALAALTSMFAAAALLVPTISATDQRFAPAEVEWIRASWNLELRRPIEGERARPLTALPAGGGAAVQVFHFITLPPGRAPPEAVFLPAVGGTAELYVNGAPIYEPAEPSAPHLALAGTHAELIPVPGEYWMPGRNRIDLVASEMPGRALAAAPDWGTSAELRPAAESWAAWTRRVQRWAPPLALGAAILCLLAVVGGRGRLYLAAGFGSLALGARALLARPELVEALGRWWAAADALLLAGTVVAGAVLLPGMWGAARAGGLRGLAAAALAGLIGGTALFALWGSFAPALASNPLAIEAGYGIGLIVLTWLAVGAGAAAAGSQLSIFLRDHVHLARLVRRQRQELDVASRALEEEMRQRAILEERQRLARDMHDGIGGRLVSLIARVRAGHIDIDQIEAALADGLTDLRLIVDSLDSAGDSLADALTAFQSRARVDVEATGMRFVWSQPDELRPETRNPRWILDLYRFLQEAVSNGVRHSGASRFEVEVAESGPGELTILIADDGAGIPEELLRGRGSGKGLRNMALRAKRLGAEYKLERGPGGRGTRIALRLPLPAEAHSSGEISPS